MPDTTIAAETSVLRLEDVSVEFSHGRRSRATTIRAADHVNLSIAPAETLGLVGESGSGKSTIARVAIGIQDPTAGDVWIGDSAAAGLARHRSGQQRRALQMVFQDPAGSLDPRQRVGAALAEPLIVQRLCRASEARRRVTELLGAVGLLPDVADRYPHQLSGGQCQRVAIARALALEPAVIICDEPVSALDVSVQAQIINQLMDLQAVERVGYLFVAHDLAVVRHIAHRVAIMYRGQIVETGTTPQVYRSPRHPYTIALLSSVLDPTIPGGRRSRLDTSSIASDAGTQERGCRFRDRCAAYRALGRPSVCAEITPAPLPDAAADRSHLSACHFADELPDILPRPRREAESVSPIPPSDPWRAE